MTPTNKLRFVERFKPVIGTNYGGTIRVLQQWWEDSDAQIVQETVNARTVRIEGEWRDVPLETEE